LIIILPKVEKEVRWMVSISSTLAMGELLVFIDFGELSRLRRSEAFILFEVMQSSFLSACTPNR